ncbi:hypothetical protein M5689_010085 [Euphorbia peplus]|nr:hypothetical protein M5689_010085 [Euphorbia peplus]
MGYNSSIKRSSTPQKNSKMVKDTVLLTQAFERRTGQEILKAKRRISKPYGDLPHEPRQLEKDGNLVQQKTSKNGPEMGLTVKATKDDELVRYMSNVPGYLQRVEKKENMQGNPLNMGVLDWGRLENFKCNQKDILVGVNKSSLPCNNLPTKTTTNSSAFHSPSGIEAPAYVNSKHLSGSSKNHSYHNARSSSQDALPSHDVENASNCMVDEERRVARNFKSSVTNSSYTTPAKAKRRESDHKITSKVEHQPSNSKSRRVRTRPKERVSSYDREAKQTVDELPKQFNPSMGLSALEPRNSSSHSVKEKQNVDNCGTKNQMESHETAADPPLKHQQTVDELPELGIKRKAPKQVFNPSMGISSLEPRKSSSRDVKEKENGDNSGTKNQIESQETSADPPLEQHADKNRNIVLLVPKSRNSFLKEPIMSLDENVKVAKQNLISDALSDKEAFASELHDEIPHSCPLPSRADTMLGSGHNASENLDETLKTLNQEAAELSTTRGRHPSPNRRFSFSLSRMARSFSFKESSDVPQLSSSYVSVKSGPVTSTSSAGADNPNREKEIGHVRARSSPLRRILDPLLPRFKGKTLPFTDERILDPLLPKYKGKTSRFTDETDQQLRGIHGLSFKPLKPAESLENEKHEVPSTQAQLVLTTSNGLPLFRFVTNSSIIIAAPLRNIIASGKNDQGCNYVVYAIDEVKKKSGSWINQASKEKSCFVYNVVGQMKLHSSSSTSDLSVENLNNQYVVTESVLFGIEPRQGGQTLTKAMPELAAVIMKKPSSILGFELEQSDKEENVKDQGFSWCQQENVQNNCTVILPGGIHSLPKAGVPSSLIRRWRTGGLCDCGGWDIGCQLRVLSNENQEQKLTRTFSSFLKSDCVELFVQGERETQQQKPVFSVAPLEKGKYSVEFSSSVSLLQAFFIGVSVISSQRSSDLAEDSKVPMKYTPTLPVSPVGRV